MLISLDIETTGLDPEVHEAWEVALVNEEEAEHIWHFPVTDLTTASPQALQMNGFYERAHIVGEHDSLETQAREIARGTVGATFIGFNVAAFDAAFLAKLLCKYGYAPAWEHRHLELGSFVAGAVGAKHALSSRAVEDMVPRLSDEDPHTALGDARWNMRVYRAVLAKVLG